MKNTRANCIALFASDKLKDLEKWQRDKPCDGKKYQNKENFQNFHESVTGKNLNYLDQQHSCFKVDFTACLTSLIFQQEGQSNDQLSLFLKNEKKKEENSDKLCF